MLNRRQALAALGAAAALPASAFGSRRDDPLLVSTFQADVTVPLGHALMGGGIAPADRVVDPLEIRGLVLTGAAVGRPVVLASIDWCEIRNDSYARWRAALAEAAGTSPDRVLLSAVHVHDAPITDLRAQRLLDESGKGASICDLAFHERAVTTAASAVRDSLPSAKPVTHVGYGQSNVDRIASNRRYLDANGAPAFGRMSATRDEYARSQPEGTIDPLLRTVSLWSGDRPVAALSHYATHPMSYYGQGGVSADFIGLARRQRQQEVPDAFQVYFSGCSGNIVAGKYNDGKPENRPELARRLADAMRSAWDATERAPLPSSLGFRSTPLRLEPRDGPGFTVADLRHRLETDERSFGRCLAALGLSWREAADKGAILDVPSLDFGPCRWLLLPAESYVEFQLHAQSAAGGAPVCVAGYGECAPGYIPTDKHFLENDSNLSDWCWIAPGSEARMRQAIDRALA